MVELEEDYQTDNRDYSDTGLVLDHGLVKLYSIEAYDLQAAKHEHTYQCYLL